jgi:hypothetical protein
LLSASRTPRSGRLGTPVRPSDLPISRGRNGTDGQPMRISQLDVLCRTRGAHKLPDHGDEIVDGERLLERSDCPQSFGRLEIRRAAPRDGDDLHSRLGAKPRDDLKPREPGDLEIGDDERGAMRLAEREAQGAIRGDKHLVAGLCQDLREKLANLVSSSMTRILAMPSSPSADQKVS